MYECRRVLLLLLVVASAGGAGGCGPPVGGWFSTCDLARSSEFNATAATLPAAGCPADAQAAFSLAGYAGASHLCLLANRSLLLLGGKQTAVGTVEATTCASIAWVVTSSAAPIFGWCRLPRSKACPACQGPTPGPPAPPGPPVPPGPGPPLPPSPPAPTPPAPTPPSGSKSVVAFYNGSPQQPSFWLDYDWSILTHVVVFGTLDPNLMSYATARGVKLLLTYSGCDKHDMSVPAVRATVVKDALRFALPPYGSWHHPNESYAGLFFDIECTTQPCPWLAGGQPAGMAAFFHELRQAWPTVFLSLYVSGAPDVRISATPNSATGAVTYPFGYSAAHVAAMEPWLDQVIFGGYASLNYSFLDANVEVNCLPSSSSSSGGSSSSGSSGSSCGGINPMQMVAYALNGTGGTDGSNRNSSSSSISSNRPCQTGPGPQAAHPCTIVPWSSVVPKTKLIYAVGWYETQHNLLHPAARDTHIGTEPSFCSTVPLAQYKGVQKTLDASGTWVFDRQDQQTGACVRVCVRPATHSLIR